MYLWIRKLSEVNTPYGVPRSYKLNWNEENHKVAQAALHKLKEGEQLNGTKTYGVLDKENEGNKANQYKSEDGALEEGRPSFEFVEVAPHTRHRYNYSFVFGCFLFYFQQNIAFFPLAPLNFWILLF